MKYCLKSDHVLGRSKGLMIVLCLLFLEAEVEIPFHVAEHKDQLYHEADLISKSDLVDGYQNIAYFCR